MNKKIKIEIAAGIILIISIIIGYLFWMSDKKNIPSTIPQYPIPQIINSAIPQQPDPAIQNQSAKVADCKDATSSTLVRKIGNNEENVFTANYGNKQIGKWQDYIFFDDEEGGLKLVSYNIKTGDKKIIFDITNNKDIAKKGDASISSIDIFGNTLFFSVGGYLVDGAMYWVDLPDKSEPVLLTKARNAGILFEAGKYWIRSGEGDACYSDGSYQLLDIEKKKLGPKLDINDDCGEGRQLIGFFEGKAILGYFKNYKFTKITRIDIYNQKKEEILLGQDKLGSVVAVKYAASEDKILLVGDNISAYDIAKGKTEKIMDTPALFLADVKKQQGDSGGYEISSWEGDKICINMYHSINLADKSYKKTEKPCSTEIVYETLPEKIKKLNLPKEYSLVCE